MDLLIEEFLALFEQGEDKQAISLFLNWFRQLAIHGRVNAEDYTSLVEVYRSVEEVKGMLQTTFAKERERWYQEGVEEGIEKGIEKGREEGIEKGVEEGARRRAVEIARAMLARGIDPVLIAEVTGLSEDELNALPTSPPPEDETR
jgi:cobalamin-dependent methionine synthase I